jgi:ABC-type spermidine/putrescine transport system permease subunit I
LIALILSSRAASFSRPSSSIILSLWDSFIVKSTVWGILIGYTGWVDKKLAVC